MGTDRGKATSPIQMIEGYLQAEKSQINDEIRSYPSPIPACDAQFNYLLEKRNLVAEELARLHAIGEEARSNARQTDALGDFVAASSILGPSAKEQIVIALA